MVGLAAVVTSLGSHWSSVDHSTLHLIAAYLGTVIGGITFTGSIAAFIKLSGIKWTFDLPLKKYLNKPLSLLNLIALIAIVQNPHNAALCTAALLYATGSSFALGWNITNSIGAADMPVAITVLNSYSGWALCA